MHQFSYILKSKKDINSEVLSVLSLIDAHPYRLPDTDMQSLGDLHDRLSVEFVDDCGSRTRVISMTMNELKSLINSLEEKNKEIEKYNQSLKGQEHALRRINNHAEANRIQPYWISPIRRIYDEKLKGGYGGEDRIEFPQEIHQNGYYTRENCKPKVVLNNSTIYGVIPTYIHEMMHAYFDEKLGNAMNDAEFAEEPLAEYGMLKFLKSFVNTNPEYDYLLDNALRNVRNKQSLGPAHYGFGEYLFLNHSDIQWEQMLHGANPLIGETVPEYKDLMRMLYYEYPDESELPKVAQILHDVLCRATGKKTTTLEAMMSPAVIPIPGRKHYYTINGEGRYSPYQIIEKYIKFKLDGGTPFNKILRKPNGSAITYIGPSFISTNPNGVTYNMARGEKPYSFNYLGQDYYISTQLRDRDPKSNVWAFREYVNKTEPHFQIDVIGYNLKK